MLSFHPSPSSVHLSPVLSCGSSPISPSVVDHFSGFELKGFHRARSEGNLEDLAHATSDGNEEFYYQNQQPPNKLSARNKRLMLQTIPSFSCYNSKATCGEEAEEYESDCDEDEEDSKVMAVNSSSSRHGFYSISMKNMSLDEPGLVGAGGQDMFRMRWALGSVDDGSKEKYGIFMKGSVHTSHNFN